MVPIILNGSELMKYKNTTELIKAMLGKIVIMLHGNKAHSISYSWKWTVLLYLQPNQACFAFAYLIHSPISWIDFRVPSPRTASTRCNSR